MQPKPEEQVVSKDTPPMNEATLRIPANRFNRKTRRQMAKNLRSKASIHTKKHTRGRLAGYGIKTEPRKKRVKWYK